MLSLDSATLRSCFQPHVWHRWASLAAQAWYTYNIQPMYINYKSSREQLSYVSIGSRFHRLWPACIGVHVVIVHSVHVSCHAFACYNNELIIALQCQAEVGCSLEPQLLVAMYAQSENSRILINRLIEAFYQRSCSISRYISA